LGRIVSFAGDFLRRKVSSGTKLYFVSGRSSATEGGRYRREGGGKRGGRGENWVISYPRLINRKGKGRRETKPFPPPTPPTCGVGKGAKKSYSSCP